MTYAVLLAASGAILAGGGCAPLGSWSSSSGGSSFNREFYFATAEDAREMLADVCIQHGLVIGKHPSGVIAHRFNRPGAFGYPEFVYVATVQESATNIEFWSHVEFPYRTVESDAEDRLRTIEQEFRNRVQATGPSDECRHYGGGANDAPTRTRFELRSADQVAKHVGETVTIRGFAERRSDGIFLVGPDVLVRLPQWCDSRDEPRWMASVTGQLRAVNMPADRSAAASDNQSIDDAAARSVSGTAPALFELVL